MVNIFTDSCSDMGKDLEKRYNIHVIPLTVIVNNRTFRDGVDIQGYELFDLVEKSGELPKTSAPSMVDFMAEFNTVEGDILFVGISSKLSATVQNAMLAGKELNGRNIRVIDSLNLSTGIGLLVLKAAHLRDQGKTLHEIGEELEAGKKKVHTSFAIDRLDYIYMGGRCSAMENIMGSLLKIRPIIEVHHDGTLVVKEKTRGKRHKSLASMLKAFRSHLDDMDFTRVFVTHTGCDDDAQYLKQAILEMAPIQEALVTRASCTVSSHCGPGTIGILYMTK